MPTPIPPVKTPLGLEEMRTRSHGLNQRHRTVLFLVDGRRPLSEVLALASQAGSSTSHFEDLVHLGLIELTIETEAAEAAEATELPELTPSQMGALDSGGASTQSGVMAVDLDPPTVPADVVHRPSRPVPLNRETPATAAPLTIRPIALDSEVPSAASIEQRRARSKADNEALLHQVRELLVDTLRIDAPVFAAITLMRVHRARSARELINLVWEIERHLGVSRKRHRGLQSLHQARELLGMGNTQISLDSETGFPDTE